jgi:kinesin family protein 2/24
MNKLPHKNTKKIDVVSDIEKLKIRREERKKNAEDKGKSENKGGGLIDMDYEKMMKLKKNGLTITPDSHSVIDNSKIFVIVRKRPIFKKEIAIGEIDCVSTVNPRIFVHECKIKVDGITKYIEDQEFCFDNSFGDDVSTEDVYRYTVMPAIDIVMKKGIVTCFAYGQTGSGKTHTMKGIQNYALQHLFEVCNRSNKKFDLYCSFFEIYRGRLYDLLNGKNKLSVLEDKNQKMQIYGLEEKVAKSPEEMSMIIELANSIRTTHNTVTNETSSRSHAICNVFFNS